MDYISHSENQTGEIALDIIKNISSGGVLALTGDLGSGKTTFVKGLARALNIKKDIVSPTFVILKEYSIPKNDKNIKFLIHADCYRLGSREDAEAIGLLEYFEDKNCLVVLEWPENIQNALPDNTKFINFEYINEKERKITTQL